MLLSPSIKVYLLLSVFIPFPITAIATLAPHAFSQRAKPGGGDCQAKPPINGPQASAVQPGYSWPTGDHEYMMIHVWILYIYVYINTCNYIYMPVMHIMCGVSYSYLQWFWPYSMRERRRCLLLRIHHNHRRDRSCEFHEYYYHGHHDSHANVDVQ
jgi:hypothetical protein